MVTPSQIVGRRVTTRRSISRRRLQESIVHALAILLPPGLWLRQAPALAHRVDVTEEEVVGPIRRTPGSPICPKKRPESQVLSHPSPIPYLTSGLQTQERPAT